ncbi:hypothetical protein A3B35_01835 [Candidatus Kaiserbacteria bacterium RIFCSPLOWO2_01_FULL_54_24]|uniref:DUF5667 domain-containing protein n=1 Tax=Candidatus Kaiserbacteria bacterium RIFCSPLOWO2_01_FULL_54_24 TaxID=1798515 RepID=A0A1F6EVA6_9BACT|nr:MAG: hypothetical protein A3B35_01835 [Candidatus Kaiserbacteria bacterium RIFCSPLOWO2_01_FULL_54_24]
MWLRTRRLLVSLGLCASFGAAVWFSDAGSPDNKALAASLALALPVNVADDTANKQCPPDSIAIYRKDLPVGACPPTTTTAEASSPAQAAQLATALAANCLKKNAYGKLCQYSRDKLVVEGKCFGPKICKGFKYINDEGDRCELSESGAIDACTSGGVAGKKTYSQFQDYLKKLDEPSAAPILAQYNDGNNPAPTLDEAFKFNAEKNVPPGSTAVPYGAPTEDVSARSIQRSLSETPPARGTQQQAPDKQIENIANAPTGNYGNYGGMPSARNYFPSGILSSLSGLGGPSNNYAPRGGSIAYVSPIGGTAYLPTGPVSVTNTSFDALSSQVTFGDSLQTPYGSISQLSKNPRLTAEERAVLALLERSNQQVNKRGQSIDAGVLRNSITDATSNIVGNVRDVISGVADFFASMFVPPGDRELSEEEKAAEEARKALRFFLEPQENVLAIGDPEALPTEIPDDEFQPAQGPGGSFSQSQTFSSGDAAADSTSGAIGAIANSNGQAGGGGVAAGTDASESGEASDAAPDAAGSESIGEDTPEPQGVVAKVKKAVGSLVSNVGNAIKSGFLRILSWFF